MASLIRPMAADTCRRGGSKGSNRGRVVPVLFMVEDTYLDNINKTTRMAISPADMLPTSIRKAKDREIGR